jgi:hypothetical protein
LRLGAGPAALAALSLAAPALADDIPRCALLPPVEEADPSKLPPILAAALIKDLGQIALPGAPFDATDEVKIGVSHRLIWVRRQGTRWVAAVEEGGHAYHDVVMAYELGYDGSLAGVRKDIAFPATVCQVTERDLWR